MNERASGMLGILNRAGLLVFGPSLETMMRKGALLLLAADASDNTSKNYRCLAERHHVPILEIESKSALGAPLGKEELSAVLITQKKAAESFRAKLTKGVHP